MIVLIFGLKKDYFSREVSSGKEVNQGGPYFGSIKRSISNVERPAGHAGLFVIYLSLL